MVIKMVLKKGFSLKPNSIAVLLHQLFNTSLQCAPFLSN